MSESVSAFGPSGGGISSIESGFQPSPHVAQLITDAIGALLLAVVVIVLVQIARERRR